MKYLIFSLILAYIPLWMQINVFLTSFGKKKKPLVKLTDENISKLIYQRTKTKIDYIRISESNLPFGMMAGIPLFPQLILSRKLYETFNKDELEYVLFHEVGHYRLWHSTQELFTGIILFIIGLFVVSPIQGVMGIVVGSLMGMIFGVLMIQFAKFKEIEADKYALKYLSNPKGMITATSKFYDAYVKPSDINPIIRFLFYRGNPYPNRIKMAEEKMKNG